MAQAGVYLQSGWMLGCHDGTGLGAPGGATPRLKSNLANIGPLGAPQMFGDFGLRVPEGFSVRMVARTGVRPLADKPYIWHELPDGGACFGADDGGWVYVSNSEKNEDEDENNVFYQAGVGALRFDAGGQLVDAYPILSGTTKNCAGGPTPWGTWLSCEETDSGYVYECYPFGTAADAVMLPALGKFQHEAAAVDPRSNPMHVYMTEDQRNEPAGNGGLFYRFVPHGNTADGTRPDLGSGRLQAAVVASGDIFEPRAVTWVDVPNPEPLTLLPHEAVLRPIRNQLREAEHFDGGEGIWYHPADHSIVFSTKGDNRLWRYDIGGATVQAIYDDDIGDDNILSALDNVIMNADGDIICCEDGDDSQVVGLLPDGRQVPLLQFVAGGGPAGPSFNPDGTRLYVSGMSGATYEITGPWFVRD
jgi:uncharacterized protein